MSWKYYVVIPEVDLYCDVVGILWALYLKLLCGEMLAQVYSVEPEILM
ncbi:TPA: hypothetical protein ACH64J_001739 [Staphylococcus aureus]|nr:hypothetical protein [Staphylococcus aureus]MBA6031915.1 hypothetical protein [Staphylococcus aureus]MBY0987422.1 hypothetical protein [Staphylococcus aureus]MCB8317891.1 hypothetical protein [Staphylococcus aureus]NEF48255.1 hypothetical protein [Staphylococcus aureus]